MDGTDVYGKGMSHIVPVLLGKYVCTYIFMYAPFPLPFFIFVLAAPFTHVQVAQCVHVLVCVHTCACAYGFVWCTGEEGTEVTLSFAKPADFDFKSPASLESLSSRGKKKVDQDGLS